jgi:transposase
MVIFLRMGKAIRIVQLAAEDRAALEKLIRTRTAEQRVIERAQIVLGSADGLSNREICEAVGVSHPTVTRWINRYEEAGLEGLLRDRPRPGRPKRISRAKIAEIIRLTQQGPPPELGTHWSTRTLAPVVGLSRDSVHRIWRSHGLQPHRVRTFKISQDPHFVEKLHDVVGLYLNPPERAVVFSVDAKTQIQALDRTQPGLPLKKGRAGTMTHDYKRHGTTTLFAALEIASGSVVADCMPRQRHQEFLRFMKKVMATVEPRLDVHFILDNSSVHKHPAVKEWLAKHPRVHFHFTPTSSSWLNLIERFFGELTQRQIRRLAVTSVNELVDAINSYVEHRNQNPKPFVWTASVQQILDKVGRAKQTLETLH